MQTSVIPFTISCFLFAIFMFGACGSDPKADSTSTDTEETSATQDQEGSAAESELDFLKGYDGKYVYEVELFFHPVITKRLTDLLGAEKYAYLNEIWQTQAPIDVENGSLYVWGMEENSGGNPGALIMADLDEDIFYVAIRNEEGENTYVEKGADIPEKMQNWLDSQ